MKELAKSLPEYPVVRAMGGVGDTLATRLIADIGDVRRFHNGKALIAFAGIDVPPYQSGPFVGPEGNAVYLFILKKEVEGKPKKVAKIAGLNNFLRIYYARVREVYSN